MYICFREFGALTAELAQMYMDKASSKSLALSTGKNGDHQLEERAATIGRTHTVCPGKATDLLTK